MVYYVSCYFRYCVMIPFFSLYLERAGGLRGEMWWCASPVCTWGLHLYDRVCPRGTVRRRLPAGPCGAASVSTGSAPRSLAVINTPAPVQRRLHMAQPAGS